MPGLNKMTRAESIAGIHRCPEWDYLLVRRNMPEWGDQEQCRCGHEALSADDIDFIVVALQRASWPNPRQADKAKKLLKKMGF